MTPEQTATTMKYSSIALIVFGIIFGLPAFHAISAPGILMIDMFDWPIDGGSANLSAEARWFAGIGGGLVIGMAMLFLTIVVPLIREGNMIVRKGAIQSLLAWFVFDSSASVAAGFASNVIFNSLFLVLLLVPLLAMRKEPAATEQLV